MRWRWLSRGEGGGISALTPVLTGVRRKKTESKHARIVPNNRVGVGKKMNESGAISTEQRGEFCVFANALRNVAKTVETWNIEEINLVNLVEVEK